MENDLGGIGLNDSLFDCSNDVTDVGINDNPEDDFADDEVSDDEDNLSFDSNITDATWKIDLSDDENEDFASLDTTPTNNNDFKDTIPIVDNISAVDSFDEVLMPSPPLPSGKNQFYSALQKKKLVILVISLIKQLFLSESFEH